MIVAGCNRRIFEAFEAHKIFWLNRLPARNQAIDGFAVQPETLPAAEQNNWEKIAPTTIMHDAGTPQFATDDWPFLYLQDRLIPDLSIRSIALLGILGIGMVYLFLPRASGRFRLDGRMFFLGAAFMLLETKAVVQLALLFGSTWLVNSLVFFTALVLILLANLLVAKAPPTRLTWYYVGLIVLLIAAIIVPFNLFLSGNIFIRYVVPCVLALGPMFFGGVIFAQSFRESPTPEMAFGSNIAGSVLGGLVESLSMLLGFQYLLLLAILFYVLSAWFGAPVKLKKIAA